MLYLRSQAFQPDLRFADVLLRLCFVSIQLRELSGGSDLCILYLRQPLLLLLHLDLRNPQVLLRTAALATLDVIITSSAHAVIELLLQDAVGGVQDWLAILRYDYARMHDIVSKDYSEFVDISRYKDQNPNKRDRTPFTKDEIKRLWELAEDPYYQIILMLIYNGCRISEFLDLKKEHVHLDEQYFDVIASKTENGIRKVPIADKVLPFYRAWYEGSTCEYLLHTPEQKHFDYRNYYDSYFISLMEQLGFEHQPHDTRHTCISLLAEAHVDQTMIKKIVGHKGAMSLTERVYTHPDIKALVDAINMI